MGFLAITCSGMPDYTARLIRQLIKDHPGRVEVVATRPTVPIEGMERSLGQAVHWVDGSDKGLDWRGLGLAVPDLVLLGGYFIPAFASLARQVRHQGGKVVLASDNNWQGGFRQTVLDPLRHRLLLRHRFDAVMTAGKSGTRYSMAMGYDPELIVNGMYGADPALFFSGPPLAQRPKKFLFVGQLIERKNVLRLAEAFACFARDNPDWTLEICGSGPLRNSIPGHDAISIRDFVQPAQLAELMRSARALVLPSLEEHWGVVVHEAALSGCLLLLSTAVGAADDFATPENAFLFNAVDGGDLEASLRSVAAMNNAGLERAQAVSVELAGEFGPQRFSFELRKIARKLGVQ